MKPRDLLPYRGRPVRIYLYDGVAFDGVFATEVLDESAISVNLAYERHALSLNIEDIVDVLPPSSATAQAPA